MNVLGLVKEEEEVDFMSCRLFRRKDRSKIFELDTKLTVYIYIGQTDVPLSRNIYAVFHDISNHNHTYHRIVGNEKNCNNMPPRRNDAAAGSSLGSIGIVGRGKL